MSKWISKERFSVSLHKVKPAHIIIFGFFMVISVGAFLLVLPISSVDHVFTSPYTAYFTATSATCVTGLAYVDTELYWSGFGQAVILLLIQIGGLGVMTMTMMFSLLLKRRVSPKERVIFVQSMNLFSGEKMFSFVKKMLAFTFTFEGLGAFLLSLKFIPMFGFWNGLWKSVFHAVSAFCNAGFDILGKFSGEFSNLEHFADDPYVNIVFELLIICGGLGFIVWVDIYRAIKEHKKLMLYSKMVIAVTLILIFGGAAVFLGAEWSNPETMGNATVGGKILRALFLSVTCRTAGFSTMPLLGLQGGSKTTAMLLMFIGGSSGSCAGGIKTVTIAVILISVFQIAKGKREIDIRKHRIENNVLTQAFSLFTIAGLVVMLGGFILSFTEKFDFVNVAFEAFSAFGTVGLSTGVTPELSHAGMIVIMALMFFGRVGIITITYAILMGINDDKQAIKYPKANLLIG